jgi:hypothetical protein
MLALSPGVRFFARAIVAIALLVLASAQAPLRAAYGEVVVSGAAAPCAARASQEQASQERANPERASPDHDGAPRPACGDACRHCLRADAPLDWSTTPSTAVALASLRPDRRAGPIETTQQAPRPHRTASWSSRAPPAIG